jgi:hypothetical protein
MSLRELREADSIGPAQESGDNLSCEQPIVQNDSPGDIRPAHEVTNRAPRGDKSSIPIRKNHQKPSGRTITPPPPSASLQAVALTDMQLEWVYLDYPQKVGKARAFEAMRKAIDHIGSGKDMAAMEPEDAVTFLRESARRYARSPAGMAGEYTPHMANWLNDHRYLDDEREWQHGGNSRDSRNAGKPTIGDRQIVELRRAVKATTGEDPDLDGRFGECEARDNQRARAPVVLEGAR